MQILVTNNYEGGPLLWEYNDGKVERLDLVDFTRHNMLIDYTPPLSMRFPPEIYEKIIGYVMEIRLTLRNHQLAFELCTLDRRSLLMFYKQIYHQTSHLAGIMLYRLGRTFELVHNIYEDYILRQNNGMVPMAGIRCYRRPSLRHTPKYEPWDFTPDVEAVRLEIDEGFMLEAKSFPHFLHGGSVWVHGYEDDGVYTVSGIDSPGIVLILQDYTFSLIPSYNTVSNNWSYFSDLLKRTFGPMTGVYLMVKEIHDRDNPFIELTDNFLRL